MKSKLALAAVLAFGAVTLSGCFDSDANVASENLSKEADQFKVARRITFVNGITDKYLMVIEGKCSIQPDTASKKLDVTCKVGENPERYKKHFLGLSDNVTYFVEQVDGANVSSDHYKVIWKPETLLPDFDRG
jgi:hypothetical protein